MELPSIRHQPSLFCYILFNDIFSLDQSKTTDQPLLGVISHHWQRRTSYAPFSGPVHLLPMNDIAVTDNCVEVYITLLMADFVAVTKPPDYPPGTAGVVRAARRRHRHVGGPGDRRQRVGHVERDDPDRPELQLERRRGAGARFSDGRRFGGVRYDAACD